jgi:hypothetical protein
MFRLAVQYVVETLSRLRGCSARLKSLFKKDMHQFTYAAAAAAPTPNAPKNISPSRGAGKHRTASQISQVKARSEGNMQSNIGSIGDYILVDVLLGDVDLDMFAKVEAHYISALQKRVFRVWSNVIEDRTGQFR